MLRVLSGLLVALLLAAVITRLIQRRGAPGWHHQRARRDAEEALRRHPAGRGRAPVSVELAAFGLDAPPTGHRVAGPDDDEDFLRVLDRRIRGDEQGAGAA